MSRPAIGMIGAGRFARTIAPLLRRAGYRIAAVTSARAAPAQRLARSVRARACGSSADVLAHADWILLAVPDREIASVARMLAGAPPTALDGKVVLHHAGALGLEPLAPLAARGAEIGVLHPLQTLSDPAIARAVVRGSRARIEGTPGALRAARRIASDLGLVPLVLRGRGDDRVAYHAAAAIAANDLLALLDLAARVLATAGVARRTAERALVRLARGAIDHAERHGLARSRTGPVVRGDTEVVAAHLRVLRRRLPEAARVHRDLSRGLLALGRAPRAPDPVAQRRLARLLGARRGRAGDPTV